MSKRSAGTPGAATLAHVARLMPATQFDVAIDTIVSRYSKIDKLISQAIGDDPDKARDAGRELVAYFKQWRKEDKRA